MQSSRKIIPSRDFFIDDSKWHDFQNSDIFSFVLECVLSKTKKNGYDVVQNMFNVNANKAVKIIIFFEPYYENSNKSVKYKPRIFIGNVSKQYEITDLLDAEESMIFENYNMLQQKKLEEYKRILLNKLNKDAVREDILQIIREDNFTNYNKNNNYNARNEIYKFVQTPHSEKKSKMFPYFNVCEDDIKNLEKVNCFGCWYQPFC
ncbi:MAG: hypothetical protein IJT15_03150 [Rickettsiales bacterium]|nr:hypothetical protein [Rickettsiales bacterium]